MTESICPEELVCYTEEEHSELIELFEEQKLDMALLEPTAPMGDVEAGLDFVATLLTLDLSTIMYVGVTATIFATYALSIYAVFKWIQSKFI